jgi:hypothetical protein
MPAIQCQYYLCYHNDNTHRVCMRKTTSFDFTGVCEYLEHCDEYECVKCARFAVCEKEKKEDYLREAEGGAA